MIPAFFAVGSFVAMGSGLNVTTPGTWTSLGCVVDMTPNEIVRSFTPVKPCLNSTNRQEGSKPGTIDYGSFAVTLRFDTDQYDTIEAALVAGTTKPIANILGDTGKALVGTCYVEKIGIPQLTDEGEVQITASFKIVDSFAKVAASTIPLTS